jgi:AbrB family looped-hinge helix DNA binding protein
MATIAQKVGPKFQVTIPKHVRDALGIKAGDLVETSFTREGAAIIRPVDLVPRKVDIEQELKAAMADVKAGHVSKPFKSARALVRDALRHGRESAKNRPVR